ncbi:hypothetical protein A2U01_0026862, partial [Trifolium medium]|nr:hypothetical protein [Trifolium medium]
ENIDVWDQSWLQDGGVIPRPPKVYSYNTALQEAGAEFGALKFLQKSRNCYGKLVEIVCNSSAAG